MKCLKCNNEINDNSKFCEYCGNRVESNINITNNQIYNNIPNQNIMMNTNNNYMDNINNNLQTNNVGYNNSNINDSVSNNVMMNSKNQSNNMNNINGLNQSVSDNSSMLNNVNSNINTNADNNIVNTSNDSNQIQNSINVNLNNNINTDFKTLEGAINLFRSVNCYGKQNIIFVAYRDLNSGPVVSKRGLFAGIFGGAVGSFANGVAEGADRKMKSIEMANAVGINDYDALLINVTDNGLGIIPLLVNGSKILPKLDKFESNINNFVFLNNSMIQSIIFDKYPLNGKAKTIKILVANDIILELFANLEEKLVPYQKESMNVLVNMYGKK